MPSTSRLLCYGRDLRLLETRQQIFQYGGFSSEITDEALVLETKLREEKFDMLILCHSLYREDWSVVRQAAQRRPYAPTLLFLLAGARKGELQETEQYYESWLDPQGLLDFVKRLSAKTEA